jgi:hypothetical protein
VIIRLSFDEPHVSFERPYLVVAGVLDGFLYPSADNPAKHGHQVTRDKCRDAYH